jgi:hypothetical protein
MHYILLWLSLHRMAMVIVLAIVLWCGAYGWYFKLQIGGFLRRGQPHSWSVDLAAKTAMSRGKQEG